LNPFTVQKSSPSLPSYLTPSLKPVTSGVPISICNHLLFF
jgi:hypothetical protein